jgi:hypothetical protein
MSVCFLYIANSSFIFCRCIMRSVVGLERGPLSRVSTTEELLDRKVAVPFFESREYGRRDPSRWPRSTLYPQKLAITSPTSGGLSVGIVRSRTQTMEFVLFLYYEIQEINWVVYSFFYSECYIDPFHAVRLCHLHIRVASSYLILN